MNLITYNTLHSFDHTTRQISVIYDTNIDLDRCAIIKNIGTHIVVASHVNLIMYGLVCDVTSYNNRTLYIHRSSIQNTAEWTLYHLTKSLTEEKYTLNDILECPIEEVVVIVDKKLNIEAWIQENIPFTVESMSEIDTYLNKYKNHANDDSITLKEWNEVFLKMYSEDLNSGVFNKRSANEDNMTCI